MLEQGETMTMTDKAEDVIARLAGYNPPDRTIDEDREIAQDIADALALIASQAAEIERLRTALTDILGLPLHSGTWKVIAASALRGDTP
jgi:hypothetical protein